MDDVTQLDGREGHVGEFARIGIVTVSDRASAGAYEDEGGPLSLASSTKPWLLPSRCTTGVSLTTST